MAKATKIPEDSYTVNLELTAKEARTLVNIVRSVGGNPVQSARKYSQNIELALENAGIKGLYEDYENHSGTIEFKNDAELPLR